MLGLFGCYLLVGIYSTFVFVLMLKYMFIFVVP